ncbi:hypothetical protein IG631_14836 [Alternaria alternata]|nr:hypothetical protein IG631_14836 [Alternaria alternata]
MQCARPVKGSLHDCRVSLVVSKQKPGSKLCKIQAHCGRTFHFSISSCFNLYCLTNSSSACFRPSELVCRIGTTSLTVRSVKTPLIMRKHFRSPGSGCSVSKTSLVFVSISCVVMGIESGVID